MTGVAGEVLGEIAHRQQEERQRIRDSISVWQREPTLQLARARELWPDVLLPDLPVNFERISASEVLLLHVPGNFDSLWDKVDPPGGYTKDRIGGVRSGGQRLRLLPTVPWHTEPIWLGFDSYGGDCYGDNQFYPAASEVLSALIQFPDWPLSWFTGPDGPMTGEYGQDFSKFAKAPIIGGYEMNNGVNWSNKLVMHRWDGGRSLILETCSRSTASELANSCWATPRIRVLDS